MAQAEWLDGVELSEIDNTHASMGVVPGTSDKNTEFFQIHEYLFRII